MRSAVLASAALLIAVACTSPVAPNPSASSAGSPIPDSAPAATPSASPLAAGPAWRAVLGQIGKDGSVSKETALQAFSLAFGPLPGVKVPAGEAGYMPSGTMALRWLGSFWDKITADQRTAAVALIPELGGFAVGPSTTARIAIDDAVYRPGPGSPVVVLAAQKRSNAFYTQLAQQMVAEIGSRLTTPLSIGLTIDAHVGLTEKATSGMETGVYNASGGRSGAAARCIITVSPLGDAAGDGLVNGMMAHEAWHCYEGAIVGLARFWSDNPSPWIMEGEAEWVGDTLYPDVPLNDRGPWPDYLEKPGDALFGRAYSAIGFYAHLSEAGIDPWGKLVPILQEKTNATAFTAAGADADAFLDTWASGFLRDGARQAAWEITGPAVTTNVAVPTDIRLSNGGSVGESAAAWTNEIAVFGETPDVLTATFSGHARMSDGAGHDYLIGDSGTFCTLSKGCVCPGSSGEPPPLPLEGDRVALAVTGGSKGATGTLSGTSLDDFCSIMTGTWVGTWANDPAFGNANGGFTMKAVQKGNTFTGTTDVTGPTCVRHGTVTGTINGGTITFGSVAAARTVNFTGTLNGTSISGTWDAIACGLTITVTGTWQATKQK
jgi:hypothetical protein